jgi:hypothetical protein
MSKTKKITPAVNKQKNISKEKLTAIIQIKKAYNDLKIRLADIEIEKTLIIESIKELKGNFSVIEKEVVDEFGKDAKINLVTGEVTTN